MSNETVKTAPEVVKHQPIGRHESLVLYTNGDVVFPDGVTRNLADLLTSDLEFEELKFHNKPGNVFLVKGDILYAAGALVHNDESDFEEEIVVMCVDWREWSLCWNRTLSFGYPTALAITDDWIFVGGAHDTGANENRYKCTMACLSLAGHLTWQVIESVSDSFTPTVTEIEPKFDKIVVMVDQTSQFFQKAGERWGWSINYDGITLTK